MKNIVVAIDFSSCSIHALKYAILLANKINANITMVWINKPSSEESIYKNQESILNDEVNKRFDLILKEYSSQLNGKLEFKIRKGKVYQEVINQAKYTDAYLIIAGTHGASGFEELFIGSNAGKIVAASECPVITVRQDFNLNNFSNPIILPIEGDVDTRQKVPMTAEIAKILENEVHVLEIYTTNIKEVRNSIEKYSKQAIKYLNDHKISNKLINIESHNISSAIIDYSKKNKAGIITVLSNNDLLLNNLQIFSWGHQIINNSPVPVLSIHSKDIISLQPRL